MPGCAGVVGRAPSRSRRRSRSRRDRLARRRRERHREGGDRRAGIALRRRETSPTETVGRRVVVDDRPGAATSAGRRVHEVGQVHGERLVELVQEVALHVDVHGLRRLPGREDRRARRARVVGRRESPCRRRSCSPRVIGLPDGAESDTVKVAVVVPASPSVTDRIVDRDRRRRVVVHDRADTGSVGDGVPDGFERSTEKVSSNSSSVSPFTTTFTVLEVCPGAKLRVVLTAPVVRGGGRGCRRPSYVNRDRERRRVGERDRERGRRRAGVALGHALVVDRDLRERIVVADRAGAPTSLPAQRSRVSTARPRASRRSRRWCRLDVDVHRLRGLTGGERDGAGDARRSRGASAVPSVVA